MAIITASPGLSMGKVSGSMAVTSVSLLPTGAAKEEPRRRMANAMRAIIICERREAREERARTGVCVHKAGRASSSERSCLAHGWWLGAGGSRLVAGAGGSGLVAQG